MPIAVHLSVNYATDTEDTVGSLPDRIARPRLALPYTVVAERDVVHLVAGEDHRYTLSGAGLEAWPRQHFDPNLIRGRSTETAESH